MRLKRRPLRQPKWLKPPFKQPSQQTRQPRRDQHQIRAEVATDFSDNKEAIEVGAAEETTIRPRATMSVISAEDRDTGPETVQPERRQNSQQHPQLRRQPRSWTTRLSVVGLGGIPG